MLTLLLISMKYVIQMSLQFFQSQIKVYDTLLETKHPNQLAGNVQNKTVCMANQHHKHETVYIKDKEYI
jgi:hypothetical protein